MQRYQLTLGERLEPLKLLCVSTNISNTCILLSNTNNQFELWTARLGPKKLETSLYHMMRVQDISIY